jgi:tetratricopeptide (TPR) repeat protein
VGRYQDVLDLAQANLATSEDLEEAHYYRGLALEALGRIEEARQAYQMALKYNPNFRRAAEALAALD